MKGLFSKNKSKDKYKLSDNTDTNNNLIQPHALSFNRPKSITDTRNGSNILMGSRDRLDDLTVSNARRKSNKSNFIDVNDERENLENSVHNTSNGSTSSSGKNSKLSKIQSKFGKNLGVFGGSKNNSNNNNNNSNNQASPEEEVNPDAMRINRKLSARGKGNVSSANGPSHIGQISSPFLSNDRQVLERFLIWRFFGFFHTKMKLDKIFGFPLDDILFENKKFDTICKTVNSN